MRHRLALALGLMATAAAVGAEQRVVLDLPLPPAAGMTAASASLVTAPALEQPLPAVIVPDKAADTSESSAATAAAAVAAPETRTITLRLRRNESLFAAFQRLGLSRTDLIAMDRGDRRLRRHLRRLQPGQEVMVTASAQGRIQSMRLLRKGPEDRLIERTDDGRFSLRTVPDAVVEETARAPRPEPGVTVPAVAPEVTADAAPSTVDLREQQVTVRAGDSLYLIFRRLGISPTELARLMASGGEVKRLKRLRPGQKLTVGLAEDSRLVSLKVAIDETRTLLAESSGKGFATRVHEVPLERRVVTADAVIENSLFLAGQRAGLSDRVIMELTEIFGWDVDFALDVRAGDRFTVIYEELYKDGEKVRDGHILASEFFNRGRSVRAVRYVFDSGRAEYFSPKGLSMRKAFLRTPVRFSRISSRFSRARMHPILQRMRAHRGVDYAAPRGTPVKAAGDGRVVFSGWKGGYGRTVIIKHGSTYTTLYGHLSRVHRRARRNGSRVQQGQIIGYVGKTGLATGPHLHYEFRVRGVHKDPLRVKLPKALPIEARHLKDFTRKSRPLVAQLDTLARTSIASSD